MSVGRYYPKLVYQTCALNAEFCRQRYKVGVCSHQFLMLVVCYPVEIIKVQRLMEKVGWSNLAKLPASDGHDHQTILKLLRTTARSVFKAILDGFHHCPTWSSSLYTCTSYITIVTWAVLSETCQMSTIGNVYAAWFWMHLLAACVAPGVVNGLGWIRYLDDPCYQ